MIHDPTPHRLLAKTGNTSPGMALVTQFGGGKVHPLETPTERAHRLCTQCGHTPEGVDWLIDAARDSPLDREAALRLHREQYSDPAQADLCEPCAVAVLDAAEDL